MIVIAVVSLWIVNSKQSDNETNGNNQTNNKPVYDTKEQCEASSNSECAYAMCDYVPEGKTYEEVCGKNFKKGWRSLN